MSKLRCAYVIIFETSVVSTAAFFVSNGKWYISKNIPQKVWIGNYSFRQSSAEHLFIYAHENVCDEDVVSTVEGYIRTIERLGL